MGERGYPHQGFDILKARNIHWWFVPASAFFISFTTGAQQTGPDKVVKSYYSKGYDFYVAGRFSDALEAFRNGEELDGYQVDPNAKYYEGLSVIKTFGGRNADTDHHVEIRMFQDGLACAEDSDLRDKISAQLLLLNAPTTTDLTTNTRRYCSQ